MTYEHACVAVALVGVFLGLWGNLQNRRTQTDPVGERPGSSKVFVGYTSCAASIVALIAILAFGAYRIPMFWCGVTVFGLGFPAFSIGAITYLNSGEITRPTGSVGVKGSVADAISDRMTLGECMVAVGIVWMLLAITIAYRIELYPRL